MFIHYSTLNASTSVSNKQDIHSVSYNSVSLASKRTKNNGVSSREILSIEGISAAQHKSSRRKQYSCRSKECEEYLTTCISLTCAVSVMCISVVAGFAFTLPYIMPPYLYGFIFVTLLS